LIDAIESLIVEAHLERGFQEFVGLRPWRANEAPEAKLREVFAQIDEGRRQDPEVRTPLRGSSSVASTGRLHYPYPLPA